MHVTLLKYKIMTSLLLTLFPQNVTSPRPHPKQPSNELPAAPAPTVATTIPRPIAPPIVPQGAQCPQDWTYKFGNCYRHFRLGGQSIADAAALCVSKGGFLVKIGNNAENDFVGNIGGGPIILGGKDDKKEGVWLWRDRTPVAPYTNWLSIEPVDKKNCMMLYTGQVTRAWGNIDCGYTAYNIVCQRPPENPTVFNQFAIRAKKKKSSKSPIRSLRMGSLTSCAHACVSQDGCLSFNVCKVGVQSTCELLDADVADDLVVSSECDHYYLRVKSYA